MTTETSVYDLQPSWLRGQCLSNGLPSDVAAMLRIFESFTDSVNETLFVLTEHIESGTASIVLDALYHQAIDTAGIYQRWSEANAQEETVDHADCDENEEDEQPVEVPPDAHDQRMQKGLMEALPIYQAMRISQIVSAARALDSDRVRETMGALLALCGAAPAKSGGDAAEEARCST